MLSISIAEVIITYFLLGVYFGWMDDVHVLLTLKGEVISPASGFFSLRLINISGPLLKWMFGNLQGINWYGWLLASCAFLSIFNINFILLQFTIKLKVWAKSAFILLSTCIFIAYILENIYLLNFTRLAILLSLSSALCIVTHLKASKKNYPSKKLLLFFFLAFIIGIDIRTPVMLIILPVPILYVLIVAKNVISSKFLLFAILVLAIYGSSVALITHSHKQQFLAVNKSEKQLLNLLDGFNRESFNSMDSERDSIKKVALYHWYFDDKDTILNEKFLDGLHNNKTPIKFYVQNWKTNLKQEILKAKYYYSKDYLFALNWYNKSIILIILILISPFFIFFNGSNKVDKLQLIFCWLSIIYILILTILFKMEDRFLAPYLIFVFLSSCSFFVFNQKVNAKLIISLILIFSSISIWRIPGYLEISNQRKSDLKKKEKIIESLKEKQNNKTIFFDAYSMTLLETSPFVNVNYPSNWLATIEIYNLHNVSHQNKLINTVGCLDWPCFYSKIAEQPDKYVFLYRSEKITTTENYHKIIYNYNLRFKNEENNNIKDIKYSYAWFPLSLGLYTVDTFNLTNDTSKVILPFD